MKKTIIKSSTTDLCLTARSNDEVYVFRCTGRPHQDWIVEGTQIKSAFTGECLCDPSNYYSSLYLRSCNVGSLDQHWIKVRDYLFCEGTGRCASVGKAENSLVHAGLCEDNPSFKWTVIGDIISVDQADSLELVLGG